VEAMMKKSAAFLLRHEVNIKREAEGRQPANSIWIWGEGKKPLLSGFREKYKLKGAVISAVDLIKGIGICAGLESIEVAGATGNIHTNFRGKAEAALAALQAGTDFVFIHIEAPDECGHQNQVDDKVRAIELIDDKVVKVIMEGLELLGEDYKVLVLPDHATPLALRTHTADPVPFVIYESGSVKDYPARVYDEDCADRSGLFIKEGHKLMDYFITGGS
jgi:2,3-bisphosphoglycerate-independent phosphoglycerate mutase